MRYVLRDGTYREETELADYIEDRIKKLARASRSMVTMRYDPYADRFLFEFVPKGKPCEVKITASHEHMSQAMCDAEDWGPDAKARIS